MTEEFAYLYRLQESGVTNMLAAPSYLRSKFALSRKDAEKVALEWMEKWDQKEFDEATKEGK